MKLFIKFFFKYIYLSLNDKMPDEVSSLTDENISFLEGSNIVRGNTSSNIIGYTWGSTAIFGLNIKFVNSSSTSGPYPNSYYFDGYATIKVNNRLIKDGFGIFFGSSVIQLAYYIFTTGAMRFRKWSPSNASGQESYIKILVYLD